MTQIVHGFFVDCQQYKTEITPVSILSNKSVDYTRRNSYSDIGMSLLWFNLIKVFQNNNITVNFIFIRF